jgi:creatinine amidohydrolase/Fe(II)-dependent formamide hydrolase-like protein
VSPHDPGTFLDVWDELRVGPVRLRPNRLEVPYAVTRGGEREETTLVYRWGEAVFDPADPSDERLGLLIGSQVALNYGLFCRRLVFAGPLAEKDRTFLRSMAENTGREIWVNKFLAPNPFLTGAAAEAEPAPLPAWLRAELVFEGDAPPAGFGWRTDPARHAVLSSGGKDSLLSYGLLREAGRETHSLFVNESGRHWYTALNAFRHLRERDPHTARVWTNCDRVYAWMLRRLPFVRPDFARVRADIYPIRLWTVAVFLFGVLPLLRKREIGRLVIGDEFDTTARVTTHGIRHYDGLYDQSRWFDDAVSRYFRGVGLHVAQFSIVRPLSELLIEKLLVERYPELQRHQVSCHATHIEGDRVLPCGHCEKCRRIVGMLVALGADPRACGYGDEKIRRALADLATREVKQEAVGAEHLRALLAAAGHEVPGGKLHPEVMKVRIDPERSSPAAVPVDLRRPLLRIFREHADGVCRREGRMWVDFDPEGDPMMEHPYPFEAGKPGAAREAPARAKRPDGKPDRRRGGRRDWCLGELTWPQARRRFREVDVALLPVGALEQHGPHSPLDTDAFDALLLAERVAERCSRPHPLVLPLVPYGVSYHHEDFAGTISVTNESLARFVYDVGMGAARNGITKLVIINGHGGNAATLQYAAQMVNRDAHIFTCVDTGETSDTDIEKIAETPGDVHAGEIETSTTLAVRPELVDMGKAKRCVPEFSSAYLDFSGIRAVEWYARTRKISRDGVLGDPTKASAEKGRRIWEIMVSNLVELVEDLKRLTLDEIWQRRY